MASHYWPRQSFRSSSLSHTHPYLLKHLQKPLPSLNGRPIKSYLNMQPMIGPWMFARIEQKILNLVPFQAGMVTANNAIHLSRQHTPGHHHGVLRPGDGKRYPYPVNRCPEAPLGK